MLLPRALALRKANLSSHDPSSSPAQTGPRNLSLPVSLLLPSSSQISTPSPQRPQVEDQIVLLANDLNKVEPSSRNTNTIDRFCNQATENNLSERNTSCLIVKEPTTQLRSRIDRLRKHARHPPPHFDLPKNHHHPQAISYAPGCIVWLTGLPELNLTKPDISKLIDAILDLESVSSEPMATHQIEQPVNRVNQSSKVEYVDLTKGLTNCHIRFSSPIVAAQFVHAVQSALCSERASLIVRSIDGAPIDCSGLRANLIGGRREKIYWEKIPRHLHGSIL